VVLWPYFGDRTARMILDCLAAGACPVYRRPERPIKELHPQLAEVLAQVPNSPSLDELARQAQRLAPDADARQATMADARTLTVERHTLAHRLRSIRDRMMRS